MIVKLTSVRLSFPHLFKPGAYNAEQEPKYSACFIFPKNSEAEKTVRAAIDVVGAEKWAAKWPAVKKELALNNRLCLRDGDAKSKEGYTGQMFVSASNATRPTVVDRDRAPLAEQDGRPYAGCYVNASIDVWAMDNNYGKRICASLRGVQFAADGEAFGGGGAASAEEFDELYEVESLV